MNVSFNQDKTKIIFTHEDAKEFKALHEFPALIKEGIYFYCPAKVNVVKNLLDRFKTKFKKIALSKEIYEFSQQDIVLKAIPESFKFFTEPMDFQRIALRYMYTMGSGGLLLDPGMGKSKVVLDYIALMGFKRSVIVCPLPLLFVWKDECAIHRPDKTIHLISATDGEGEIKTEGKTPEEIEEAIARKEARKAAWNEEWKLAQQADIIVINYTKLSMLKKHFDKIEIDFLHLDEFLIKDVSSNRTEDITNLSYGIPYRCGGSGTLVNNSPLDVFAPVRYLEPSLVGKSARQFNIRHTFRNPRNPRIVTGYKGVEEVREILEACCIVMSKAEWLKLPEKQFFDIYVNPSAEQKRCYTELSTNYITKIDDTWLQVDNALVMMSKLYQISNGFVYFNDEESEELGAGLSAERTKTKKKINRQIKYFDEQPKADALKELLSGKLKTRRNIIWFNFSGELNNITTVLDSLERKYLVIRGGTKNIGELIHQFNNDPSINDIVCQAKTINYGVTILGTTTEKLEDAGYEMFPGISPEVYTQIFFSCNFSLEVYLQQQDRTHRIGQKHICEYYRIWCNTNVEVRIWKALRDKMNIRKEMLIDIAESLRNNVEEKFE